MEEFKTWQDIRDWCEDNGYKALANRMELNNSCWNSSGEFGRSQVMICDSLRFAESEEERHAVARELQSEDELIELGLIA